MNLPIFEIDDILDDYTGVHIISLVEEPAIEEEFVAFNKQVALLMEADDEQQIVKGPVMIPNKPILRFSEEIGWYYVQFTPEVVIELRNKFFKEGRGHLFNLGHSAELATSNIYIVESYIRPEDGAWIVAAKVDEPEVWKSVKAGLLKGFSIEGIFDMKLKEMMNKVKNLFSSNSTVLKLQEEVEVLKQQQVEAAEEAAAAIAQAEAQAKALEEANKQKETETQSLMERLTALENQSNTTIEALKEKETLIESLQKEITSLKETQVVIKPIEATTPQTDFSKMSLIDKLKHKNLIK